MIESVRETKKQKSDLTEIRDFQWLGSLKNVSHKSPSTKWEVNKNWRYTPEN